MKENWVVTAQEDGKKYWISRAMAVCGIILTKNEKDGKFYFLVEKRGPGCPDFVGFYCNPCGYLGWDETLAESVLREVYEETGLDFRGQEDEVDLWQIMDRPKDNAKQNVTARFIIQANYDEVAAHKFSYDSKERGGEEGEIAEIRLVCEDEIDNFEWAWNHGELLKELVSELRQVIKE